MKKFLAVLVALTMVATLAVSSFAEVYQGEGETVPELIKVPQATTKPVIDGVLEESFWGEAFIIANGTSRAEEDTFINPKDGTYLDSEAAPYANSEFFFRWDSEYLYVGVKVSKPYESQASASALWSDGTDCLQFYIGLDDGDGDMYNDPHIGFGVNADGGCTETYVQVFEQSMPDCSDSATCADNTLAAVGCEGLYTTYEVAIPLEDSLGMKGDLNDEYIFSVAFFFGSTYAYQVGQAVFWAEKSPTNSPMLVFSEALPVEEPDTTEDTTPDTTEDTTPDTTEDTTPDTTEDTTPTPDTTTTTNPSTADVSVLFYALAAVSALGGISVFKRK